MNWLWRFILSRIPKTELVSYLKHQAPTSGVLSYDDSHRLLINGKIVAPDQLLVLRESAQNALDNYALKLVREQVRFNVIQQGYLSNLEPTKDSGFYKSALWNAQEELGLLQELAGYAQVVSED